MKKNFLSFTLLFVLVLCLTACGNSGKKVNIKNMVGLSEDYIWVSEDGVTYELVDLKGNIVYLLDRGYIPTSKVINKYFFVEEKNSKKGHLYDLSGEELFSDSDGVELKSAHKGSKFTNDFSYAVSVLYKDDTKVYILDEDLTEITDDCIDGNYSVTDMYHVNDLDGFSRPDLLRNPTTKKFYEYYLKVTGNSFTLVKDGVELYELINGEAIVDNCGSYNILAKIDKKYYIVSEDGTRKEISYIPDGYSINEYCSGYIVVSANFVNSNNVTKKEIKLFSPNGKEINISKK